MSRAFEPGDLVVDYGCVDADGNAPEPAPVRVDYVDADGTVIAGPMMGPPSAFQLWGDYLKEQEG